jgi:hypothetical protein
MTKIKNVPNKNLEIVRSNGPAIVVVLNELLQLLSETCLRNGTCPYPPPCPQEYGLFGSIFTTIVLNLTSCQWYVDPKTSLQFCSTLAILRVDLVCSGLNLLVQSFDVVFVKSSAAFHRAASFTGMRVNLSVYSKTT